MTSAFVRKFLASAAIASLGVASLSGVEIVPDMRKIEPLARDSGEPAVSAAQAKILGAPARYAAAFPVFIHLSEADTDVPRKVANLGGRAQGVLPRLYAGEIPRDAARYVSNWPSVAYIEAGKLARPLLDASRPAVKADIVQSGTGLPASYSGAGSYVGIVDTGLSAGHRDFYTNGDPSKPRVAQWFPDRSSAGVDTEWHGTHVAGIAAGNGFSSGGLYTGMAPGARLLVSQSTFYTTDIPVEIDAILSVAAGNPVAVNLSLGTVYGPHDGTSGFEQSIGSRATGTPGSRQIIAAAAGNERIHDEHFQTVVPPFGAVTVPVTVSPGSATIDIWADGADRYTVTASVPGGTASVAADQPPNGATHFEVFITAGATVTGSISMRRTRNGGSGRVDGYVDAGDGSFQSSVSVEAGTITEPANAQNAITVASFNTKAGGNAGAVGAISSFSSLGPTRDGRLKPDLAAPGSVIYSAKSLDPYAGSPVPATVPGNDNYAIMQGTSMATPHVTGIAALAWESNPALTGAQMRARLKKTADLPAGVSAPNTTWGYGKANALRAVSETVASITAPATATPGAAVALASGNSSGAFRSATYSYALSYSWTLSKKPAGSGATLASNLPAPAFTPDIPGNYTVSLTVSQSAPPGVPEGTDNAVIHINTVPVATITAFSAVDNAVTFHGSATDPDVSAFGQSLTLRWVLVSRPNGSFATLTPVAGTDNATLIADVPGTYEIGLRADDGLDNSALAVFVYPPPPPRGGGGGCSVARTDATDSGANAGTVLFLLASLAGALAIRWRVRGPRN